MIKENLVVDTSDHKTFQDKKYGFVCNHDIDLDFEREYLSIYQKYRRRAERFMQDAQHPTCFIRAVKSKDEFLYIENNKEYIYKVIKSGNPQNEIVFLLLNNMGNLSDDLLWFRLGIDKYVGKGREMRTMFDSSYKFSQYCKKCILPEEIVKQNKKFDKEHLKGEGRVKVLLNSLYSGGYNGLSALKEHLLK